MNERIRSLRTCIEAEYGCSASHVRSHRVEAQLPDESAFVGDVEEFQIPAGRCFAWPLRQEDEPLKKYWPFDCFVVRELGLVKDAESAVSWVYGSADRREPSE